MTGLTYLFGIAISIGGAILCLASVFLSFMLFIGIDDDPTFQYMWGGVAVGLELIKFSLVPIGTYVWTKNRKAAGVIAVSFFVLMAFSIIASVGSLAKSANSQNTLYYSALDDKEAKEAEVQGYRNQIASRDVSIAEFQKKILLTKAKPLQKLNDKDLLKINTLNAEIKSIVIPERTELSEGISDVSILIGLDERSVQSATFIVFAIFFDIFGALSLIVSELIFLAWKTQKETLLKDKGDQAAAERSAERDHELQIKRMDLETIKFTAKGRSQDTPQAVVPAEAKVIPLKADEGDLARVRAAIADGTVLDPPTMKQLVKNLAMSPDRAEKALAQL